MNVSGIIGKLEKNADKLAFIIGAYSRHPDINLLIKHFTDLSEYGALAEMGKSITWKGADGSPLIIWKLLKSGHVYSYLFQIGGLAWLAGELNLGIIPKRYSKLGERLAKGAFMAAMTCGGSGVPPPGSSGSSGSGDSKGESAIWGYKA